MNTGLVAPAEVKRVVASASKKKQTGEEAASGALHLAFRLAEEVYAIDILRIREIVEYTPPTPVPLMPPSVRGVINLRGAVVPVIDLAVRFGRQATGVGKRTCIVIVETEHAETSHVLGLLVDGVNAVMEIADDSIEPAPTFGTKVNTEFIAGMARIKGKFVIILDIAKVLSIEEMAAIGSVSSL
jgi:purine-binding chemotaxis protein CheW